MHDGHADEHVLTVGDRNPAPCTSGHACQSHDEAHIRDSRCGHEAVPYGNHMDSLVRGHRHHADRGHCDNRGAVTVA